MIKLKRMIEELMKAKEVVVSFERSIEMAACVNNEVAMDMRIGVLPKLTEKVEKIQRAIDDLVKTHHILFETPFYEKAYILLFRDGKTIIKTYDLHENKDNQDWVLTRSKERFDEAQDSDDEGYYWAIVRYDCYLAQTDAVSARICNLALTPAEGCSLHRQMGEWQAQLDKESPREHNANNYIYFPDL
jgi:hypothetical protein